MLFRSNKTQEVSNTDLPYNPKNKLLSTEDLRILFDKNGLKDVPFNNINLYRNAFVHRSYCTMKNDDFNSGNDRCVEDCLPLQEMSYERLEFLGDAILGMVVARYLYERYPDQAEGFLSRIRTKIVNGKTLGMLGDLIGLTPFIIISKQIEESNGRTNYKIAEDCFEAFIGAIYMDFQRDEDFITDANKPNMITNTGCGYYIAEQWIIHIIENNLDFAEMVSSRTNYKDMLVKYMQHSFQDAPKFYETCVENDKSNKNQKIFTYCVRDKAKTVIGVGKGISKKDAENNASLDALGYYGAPIG